MPLKLLLVTAHPDDECFAFGGALLLAADAGVETHVVCLTDGQAATNRGSSANSADLGRIRSDEFHASCRTLGVTQAELLDYQDAQLEFTDFNALVSRLVAILRDRRPDIVLTFNADGGPNTHPDHTVVSLATTAAFHWAAWPKRFPELGPVHTAGRLFVQSTHFFLEDRPSPLPIPWTVTLDTTQVLARKQLAFAQHASQAPLAERTKPLFERYGNTEHYTLIATHSPQPAEQTTTLF